VLIPPDFEPTESDIIEAIQDIDLDPETKKGLKARRSLIENIRLLKTGATIYSDDTGENVFALDQICQSKKFIIAEVDGGPDDESKIVGVSPLVIDKILSREKG